MDDFTERIATLNKWIRNSNQIVFMGGAGVSTESGIPDFRSKDGLYNQHDVAFDRFSPEYLLSHSCLVENPKIFYEFYRQKLDVRNIKPNTTHYKLAELEKAGKLSCIITQNIDGLHQLAGSKKVYEIHGTTKKLYCSQCKKIYPEDYIFNSSEAIPHCEEPGCRGTIRPDVTLYEESLPTKAWDESIKALNDSDLLIIGGTSLTVYPAASLINYYKGDKIVIINRDSTDKDRYADLLFKENLGDVFSLIEI